MKKLQHLWVQLSVVETEAQREAGLNQDAGLGTDRAGNEFWPSGRACFLLWCSKIASYSRKGNERICGNSISNFLIMCKEKDLFKSASWRKEIKNPECTSHPRMRSIGNTGCSEIWGHWMPKSFLSGKHQPTHFSCMSGTVVPPLSCVSVRTPSSLLVSGCKILDQRNVFFCLQNIASDCYISGFITIQ